MNQPLENSPKKLRAVDAMMARAKGIYILIIKVNQLFFFTSPRCFLKERENVFSVFLSSFINTRESLGELERPSFDPPYGFDQLPVILKYSERVFGTQTVFTHWHSTGRYH